MPNRQLWQQQLAMRPRLSCVTVRVIGGICSLSIPWEVMRSITALSGSRNARSRNPRAWHDRFSRTLHGEDLFLYGPQLEALKGAFAAARFYHIEMLHALPGRQADLVKEREMESAYNQALGRPELFIFTRDVGAHFD